MDNLPNRPPEFVRPAAGTSLYLFECAMSASRSALDCSTALNTNIKLPDYGKLKIERDRFRIWAANAAAFAEGRWSLDYRLRELPEELDLVKSLLTTISARLKSHESAALKTINPIIGDIQAVEAHPSSPKEVIIGDDPDAESGASDGDTKLAQTIPEAFDYDEALNSIHTSIDWLHRLSNLLRKASVVNQNLRAQSFQLTDIDGTGLKKFFSWLVRRDFPGLSEQLKDRMAATMVERFRRILYRRCRHGAGWRQQEAYRHEEQQAGPDQIRQEEPLAQSDSGLATPAVMKQEAASQLQTKSAPVLPSKEAATEADRSRYYSPSSISTAWSGALNHDAEILLPQPPKACKTGPNFICNLCCMILESRIGNDRLLWM